MKTGVVLAAAALAIASGATSSQASTSAPIVFAADRTPTVSGEIYRLDPNGHRVDLSRSPYRDSNPVVSPDGKRVAFASGRTPGGAVYEVGIDGHGLRRVSPPSRFGFDSSTELAWQPHGERLAAVATSSGLWILQPGHKAVRNRRVLGLAAAQPWSPDGRLLLTGTHADSTTAVTPRGREAWAVPAAGPAAWSEQGLLAITDKKGSVVDVYDESGHLRFKARVGARYGTPSWSPDGSRLAVLAWPRLREWTSTGELVLDRRVSTTTSIAWDAPQRLVVVTGYHSRWLDPRSADGGLAIVTRKRGSGFTLGVAPVHGGQAKTYARIPGCWSDGNVWAAAAGLLQFAGRSIVYESRGYCDEPFSNLYSVAPDGSGLRRITNVQSPGDAARALAGRQRDRLRLGEAHRPQLRRLLRRDPDCERRRQAAAHAHESRELHLRRLADVVARRQRRSSTPRWAAQRQRALHGPGRRRNPHDLGIGGRNPAWGPRESRTSGAPSDRGSGRRSRTAAIPSRREDRTPPGLVARRPARVSRGEPHPRGRLHAGGAPVQQGDVARLDGRRHAPRRHGPHGEDTGRSTSTRVKPDGTGPLRLTKNFGVLGAWRG